MATGWWASLWGRGRTAAHDTARERQADDQESAAPVPHPREFLPADVREVAAYRAPAGASHAGAAASPSGQPVHRTTAGSPGRSGSLPDPERSDSLRPPPERNGAPPVAQLDDVIADLLGIQGASGAAIVDVDSGMALAAGGTPGFDLNVAAAGNSNVVRAKLRTISDLELKDEIEDVLITLEHQYHLINVLKGQGNSGLFIYLVLDRTTGNLALARHKLRGIAGAVSV